MSASSAGRGLAIALAIAARPAAAETVAADPPPAVYDTSPEGHRFRVGFDPASHIWLGLAGALGRGPTGRPEAGFEVDAGLGYRNQSAQGTGVDRVAWQVDHRIVAGWVRPVPVVTGGVGGSVPPLDAALYGVSMLRHDAAPSIMLPTSPPVGIPFPFDVGFDAEVGRVTTLAYPEPLRVIRFGVARGAFVLDPWRSGQPGQSFEIQIGARYDVDETTMKTALSPTVIHRVAPMTATSLRLRLQSRDGLAVVDCRGDVVPHYTSEGTWRLLALSSVHLERALIAIADQPVAAFLEGGYRYDPPRRDAEAISDFRVSLGLAMSLTLR